MKKAKHPFRFHSRATLTVSPNRKAKNLRELLKHLKEVPDSVIYQHTHHFLLQHQYLVPEPPNDIALWVGETMKEEILAERLAAVDPMRLHSLGTLRKKLIDTIRTNMKKHPGRNAKEGKEFYFMRTVVFVYPTKHKARDLTEFLMCMRGISYNSLYYHAFEAKLRLPEGNDFSRWLETALGEKMLAAEIGSINPYNLTLGGVKNRLCRLIAERLAESNADA